MKGIFGIGIVEKSGTNCLLSGCNACKLGI